jgi:uncharacterized protein YcnI
MIRKIIQVVTAGLAIVIIVPAIVSAHVIVTPGQAKPGDQVLFSVSVPNEKTVAMTGLRIEIPSGVGDVMPTVHAGWTITTAKQGDAVSSISWQGGEVPAEQRDDFTFKAQMPASASELNWKAFQTFADGSTVSWDQKPSATETESENDGPYSVTSVKESSDAGDQKSSGHDPYLLTLSLVALVLGLLAFMRTRKG